MMPRGASDNMIDGAVITLTDITEIKQLERKLRNQPKTE